MIRTIFLLTGLIFFANSGLSNERTETPQRELSKTQWVVSGILGSYFGLGIGHAIQGRWLERGWIFTVGEPVTGFLLLASAFSCGNPLAYSCGNNPTLAAFSVGTFLALRLWEIIDVWGAPIHTSGRIYVKDNLSTLSIVPLFAMKNQIGIGLEYIY